MKQNIKCCEYFSKIRHHFDWFNYQNEEGKRIYCMPHLKSCSGYDKLRINYCPSCGKEVSSIELQEK
jgi:hypothetical protein